MKIEVLNTINSFTVKVNTEGLTRQQICCIADKINEIEGFQTTEIIFLYAVPEAFIKVYSGGEKTANELDEEIKKLDL